MKVLVLDMLSHIRRVSLTSLRKTGNRALTNLIHVYLICYQIVYFYKLFIKMGP